MKLPVLAEFRMDTTFLYGHLASKTSNKLQPKSLYIIQAFSGTHNIKIWDGTELLFKRLKVPETKLHT